MDMMLSLDLGWYLSQFQVEHVVEQWSTTSKKIDFHFRPLVAQ